jgi:DNA topoisomerase VI subunit B
MDFFSEKELTAQIGHGKADWPLVLLKECLDNSIDAAEDAGVAPSVAVAVNQTGITVADNGPGIPPDTVAGVLDYAVRVSSREAYVSPTRGAQGAALKTILAMPFVLDGMEGRVSISSRSLRHDISLRVDPIRQEPVIDHQKVKDRAAKTGTAVTVYWPDSACSVLSFAKDRFLQIADDFTILNPHLTLETDCYGEGSKTKATDRTWKKWLPSYPTSSHWYDDGAFGRLLCAQIAHDADSGRERTIREFISQFDGLTGTGKQKALLDLLGLHRLGMSALRNGAGLNHAKASSLLTAMKAQTRPVKPAALGVIGQEHLRQRFAVLGCEMETFAYRKAVSQTRGLPEILETAFAWRGDTEPGRRLVSGVNWSPGIVNPFRQLGNSGQSLDAVLEHQRAGPDEPVMVVLHLTCPRPSYTDRGKSAVVLGDSQEADDV